MKKLTLLIIFILLTGCSAVSRTKGTELIRQINPDWANKCEFIGNEETSHSWTTSNMQNAKIKMLNKIYESGGNAYVVNANFINGMDYIFQFEIFKCPN